MAGSSGPAAPTWTGPSSATEAAAWAGSARAGPGRAEIGDRVVRGEAGDLAGGAAPALVGLAEHLGQPGDGGRAEAVGLGRGAEHAEVDPAGGVEDEPPPGVGQVADDEHHGVRPVGRQRLQPGGLVRRGRPGQHQEVRVPGARPARLAAGEHAVDAELALQAQDVLVLALDALEHVAEVPHLGDRLRVDLGELGAVAEADDRDAGPVAPQAGGRLDGQRAGEFAGHGEVAAQRDRPGRLLEVDEQLEAALAADRQQAGERGGHAGRGDAGQLGRGARPRPGDVAGAPRRGRVVDVAGGEVEGDLLGGHPGRDRLRQGAALGGAGRGEVAQRAVEQRGQAGVGGQVEGRLVLGLRAVRAAPGAEGDEHAGEHQRAAERDGGRRVVARRGRGGGGRAGGRSGVVRRRPPPSPCAPDADGRPDVSPPPGWRASTAGAGLAGRRGRVRDVHTGAGGVGRQPQLPAGQDQVGVDELAAVGLHAVAVEGEDLLVAQRVVERARRDVPQAVVAPPARRLHDVVLRLPGLDLLRVRAALGRGRSARVVRRAGQLRPGRLRRRRAGVLRGHRGVRWGGRTGSVAGREREGGRGRPAEQQGRGDQPAGQQLAAAPERDVPGQPAAAHRAPLGQQADDEVRPDEPDHAGEDLDDQRGRDRLGQPVARGRVRGQRVADEDDQRGRHAGDEHDQAEDAQDAEPDLLAPVGRRRGAGQPVGRSAGFGRPGRHHHLLLLGASGRRSTARRRPAVPGRRTS